MRGTVRVASADAVSQTVLHAGAFGLFACGVLNRILIVTGLHHIVNDIVWFLRGDYNGTSGDLKRSSRPLVAGASVSAP
jgi:phosphotransferase system  glucose/maltose/N-acetylglucosamine-specific IIC component